jgi:hypothetical protein
VRRITGEETSVKAKRVGVLLAGLLASAAAHAAETVTVYKDPG